MKKWLCNVLLGAAFAITAAAQPTVTGALNTASYIRPGLPNSGLAQGSMIAIFGRNLGPASIVQAGSFPLPTELGGTSARITVGGQTSNLILTYSLATQVGAIIPSTTPVGNGQLTVTFNGQTSATFPVQIVASQFGIFTINQGGTGPAVVQNVNSEADRPVNTLLAAARPGQAMILWGTGLGAIQGSDAGTPPVGNLNQPIEVLVGGRSANVLYKGRSGCCAGVDQIVFEVPTGLQGCYVPVLVKNGNNVSNITSMAVSPTGGACSDPFGYTAEELSTALNSGNLKVGSVALVKATTRVVVSGFSVENTTEVATGSFVAWDTNQLVASRGFGGSSVSVGSCTLFPLSADETAPTDPIKPRVLNAGQLINLSGPNGAKQMNRGNDGYYNVTLSTSTGGGSIPGLPGGIPGLPGGGGASAYLVPGSYSANNAGGGPDVGSFTANLNLPGNFTWTNESAINNVNRASDLTITWSGAQANGYVFVGGGSFNQSANVGAGFYCLERGSAGRLTVPAAILLGLPPSTVVQGTQTGQLTVGITNEPSRFTARGLDVGVFTYSSANAKLVGYQ